MSLVKDVKKQTVSILFKGFEILIQETVEGVVVDVYDAAENPSTGLLGSTHVSFSGQDGHGQNEKSYDFVAG